MFVKFDLQDVDAAGFGVEHAGDFYLRAFESVDKIGAVQTINVFAGGEDEISAEMLDAIG